MQDKGKIEVTFLGTGTSVGVPVIACDCKVCTSQDPRDKRFRSSILIKVDGKNIVIDCGPDFRFQMLKQKVNDIDAILFTHQHRDHIAGLDDVRAFNYILNKNVSIYGSKEVIDAIKTEFPYIFDSKGYFGAPRLIVNVINSQCFSIGNTRVQPINILHDKLNIFAYRIGDFTYITDASLIPEEEKEKIKGSKVIVINALRKSPHISHFSLQEAIEIVEELKPEMAYLTHMSHFIGLHQELEEQLPSHIRPAYDNLKITI